MLTELLLCLCLLILHDAGCISHGDNTHGPLGGFFHS